ncbi:MAG: hypothetical protein RJS98_06535, partial [Rhodospirillaceae bacterium]
LPLIDLERVEVIKGPQNAFFGRNTFAGAVNYLPARPGDEFSGKGSVSFSPSDQDSYNVTAAAGAPISDTVGVRLAVMQERVGADWNYDNGDPAGEENTTAITAVTTWEPTETSNFMASGFYVKSDDTRALQSQVGPFAPGTCNITFSGTFTTWPTAVRVGRSALTCRSTPEICCVASCRTGMTCRRICPLRAK